MLNSDKLSEGFVRSKNRKHVCSHLDALDITNMDQNSKVKKAEIKGVRPHQSHDDPSDDKLVISVRFKDEEDRRLGTGHVHEDGSGFVKWK